VKPRVPPVSPSSGSLASRQKRGLIGQEKGERKCLFHLRPASGGFKVRFFNSERRLCSDRDVSGGSSSPGHGRSHVYLEWYERAARTITRYNGPAMGLGLTNEQQVCWFLPMWRGPVRSRRGVRPFLSLPL